MARSLAEHLKLVEQKYPQWFRREKRELNPQRHEIAAYFRLEREREASPVIVFENVTTPKGTRSAFPLAHNLFASRSLCAFALGEDPSKSQMDLSIRFGEIQAKLGEVDVVRRTEAPVLQNVWKGEAADVTLLPAGRYHEKDAGDYFVMACLMKARSGEFYDVTPTKNMIFGPHRMSVSAHRHHHLARILSEYEKAVEPAPIAVVLGHHPAFYLGSCALMPYGNDDYKTIAAFMGEPLRLTPSATLGDDFLIPADAEIVVEGLVLPGVREHQNPFGEISGHYQKRMEAPVVEVKGIAFRNGAVMEGIMPAYAEHVLLGSLPKEGSVYHAIKKEVPGITAVHLFTSGMGRFSGCIAMNKRTYRDVTVAAMIAFTEVKSLKVVVVVDSEIDAFDEAEVMWAAATQVRWDKDVTVIPKVQSARSWLGDAVCIIDATRHEDAPDFPERNRIPEDAIKRLRELGF
jgi:2,5-furandicarboxylate decarboxylase 1